MRSVVSKLLEQSETYSKRLKNQIPAVERLAHKNYKLLDALLNSDKDAICSYLNLAADILAKRFFNLRYDWQYMLHFRLRRETIGT